MNNDNKDTKQEKPDISSQKTKVDLESRKRKK